MSLILLLETPFGDANCWLIALKEGSHLVQDDHFAQFEGRSVNPQNPELSHRSLVTRCKHRNDCTGDFPRGAGRLQANGVSTF